MNTHFPDSDLTRHLARKADEFDRLGGSPLELGQVLDRAGEIRRGRRMRATMVMAAAVLAIAVPTALLVRGADHVHKPITPAKEVKVDRSPLTLDGLKRGAAPRTGWFGDDIWHGPDGAEQQWTGPGQTVDVARLGKALLVATSQDGQRRANLVPELTGDSAQVKSWPLEGGFAVSNGGNMVAFVQPDGTPVVVQSSGATQLPRVPKGTGFDGVEVLGPDCTSKAVEAGCGVVVASHGVESQTWISWSSGEVTPVPAGVGDVTAVADGQLIAGITEVRDDLTTCSAVRPFTDLIEKQNGKALWTTCDHVLDTFSPNGESLLASASYGDGPGSTQLAVYDAESGEPRLDLHTTRGAVIPKAVWEDDDHVLAIVLQGTQAAIVRIGLDGSREYAVAPEPAGDDFMSPFVLTSR